MKIIRLFIVRIGAPLYSAKPHYENVKEKDLKVNMDTVKKFVSLLLYSWILLLNRLLKGY
jgi:hypothetical protein